MKNADIKEVMRQMGAKGGRKASRMLTPEQRQARAKKAARARWKAAKQEPK